MQNQSSAMLSQSFDLEKLYQRYSPKILDYLHNHVRSYEDAEDIIVEVFLAAMENERFFYLKEQEQAAWLWRVARNKLIDRYRRSTRQPQVSLTHIEDDLFEREEFNPEQLSLQLEEDNQLRSLVKQLPPLQQRVLQLRFGHNLRCAQIAEQIGKREGSVRSILSRTLNHLRSLYTKL